MRAITKNVIKAMSDLSHGQHPVCSLQEVMVESRWFMTNVAGYLHHVYSKQADEEQQEQ